MGAIVRELLLPSVDRFSLLQLVSDAFGKANERDREASLKDGEEPRILTISQMRGRRARFWVEALADGFRDSYSAEADIRVFSRGNSEFKALFSLNELLWDIMICRVATVKAPQHTQLLTYITEPIWAIESEFAPNARSAITDFSKLVLSGAPNKLFIGSYFGQKSEYLADLQLNKRFLAGC